ncbi:MAG: hypothetical protein K0M50_14975 [Prolixibacteraceae bacterium]|nr:hypothetical protein [Prolixibacteraceae bacterium]
MNQMFTHAPKRFTFSGKLFFAIILMVGFSQCRMDEDMNYRILIDNNCDFALKVYYDNQDIETHEDGVDDYTVRGSVSIVLPYQQKEIYSKYTSVWIEPVDQDDLKSRKFRSVNDGSWRKVVDVYEQDFDLK